MWNDVQLLYLQVSSTRNIVYFSINMLFENELKGVSICNAIIQLC